MSKVITVWGSPGSGKSMFCCILAKALTRDKRKAIIISGEPSVPMLPVWLPDQISETGASIGQVLASVEIDTSLVASHVTVLKSYPFIGLMGYSAGETPLSYPDTDYQMVLHLIAAARKLVDFVILDCGSSMTNVFTPAAIESGDLVARILTPDLKGINYLKAHQPLLADGRFHYSGHMVFAGMARPFHAFEEMGYMIGGFDGLLPYSKEIDRCATEGDMFQAVKYCSSKYITSLNKVLDALEQMESADRQEDDEYMDESRHPDEPDKNSILQGEEETSEQLK
ncbi:MAG: ParA family protein [Lachnospiraceae bacterium]|nr:ParA family protein [Lachnospiraceae bacterium]MCM1239017.1 ParA family protein [Lachnospiraceae bacterium]